MAIIRIRILYNRMKFSLTTVLKILLIFHSQSVNGFDLAFKIQECTNYESDLDCSNVYNFPNGSCSISQKSGRCGYLSKKDSRNKVDYPGAPMDLVVEQYRRPIIHKDKLYFYPTVYVEWRPPYDVRWLEGFKLEVNTSGSNEICRTFDLSLVEPPNRSVYYKDKIFKYDCFSGIQPDEMSVVSVTCLPEKKLTNSNNDQRISSKFRSLTAKEFRKSALCSAHWDTPISLETYPETCEIHALIWLENDFNFKQFEVRLLSKGNQTYLREKVIAKSEQRVTFTGIQSGIYRVTVLPVGAENCDSSCDGCKCKSCAGLCKPCTQIYTKYIHFSSKCSRGNTVRSDPEPSSYIITIILTTLAGVFAIIATIIVVFYIMKRKQRHESEVVEETRDDDDTGSECTYALSLAHDSHPDVIIVNPYEKHFLFALPK